MKQAPFRYLNVYSSSSLAKTFPAKSNLAKSQIMNSRMTKSRVAKTRPVKSHSAKSRRMSFKGKTSDFFRYVFLIVWSGLWTKSNQHRGECVVMVDGTHSLL